MKDLMRLRHLHLPGLTPYLRASAIQDHLVRAHLNHKATQSNFSSPGPVLITFQTPPTYTCGRREVGSLSDSQVAHLRAGGRAEFYEALRGGQTTFHGPGQLTAYLIVSLQEHGLNPRNHVRLLEDSVIGTCKRYWLTTHTTENPGVWIGSHPDDRKIASVGVHLRRHIASHGIGLNVHVDLSWFDRIVACGLPGKRATNIGKEWEALDWETKSDFIPLQNLSGEPREITGESGNLPRSPPKQLSIPAVANNLAYNVALHLSGLDSHVVEKIVEADLYSGKPQSQGE